MFKGIKIEFSSLFKWIISIGEIAAVTLLLFKFYDPTDLKNDIAFCFLGISLIIALIINLIITFKWLKERSNWLKEKEIIKLSNNEELLRLTRKSMYADVLDKINIAFCDLDRVLRNKNCELSEYLNCFTEFCTRLSKIFSTLTNSDCGVCIKVGYSEVETKRLNDYKAYTLCRDTHSKDRDNHNIEIDNYYKDNTDFDLIFKNIKNAKGKHFFSNSLLSMPYYKNTSFLKCEFPLEGFAPKTSIDEKRRLWPLSYKSTIVAPICPSIGIDRNTDKLLGFLCVDSNEELRFDEQYDCDLLVGCADGMFNVFNQFLEKFPQNKILSNGEKFRELSTKE